MPNTQTVWLHSTELLDKIWGTAGNWETIVDLTGELGSKGTYAFHPILHLHPSHQREHTSGLTVCASKFVSLCI